MQKEDLEISTHNNTAIQNVISQIENMLKVAFSQYEKIDIKEVSSYRALQNPPEHQKSIIRASCYLVYGNASENSLKEFFIDSDYRRYFLAHGYLKDLNSFINTFRTLCGDSEFCDKMNVLIEKIKGWNKLGMDIQNWDGNLKYSKTAALHGDLLNILVGVYKLELEY